LKILSTKKILPGLGARANPAEAGSGGGNAKYDNLSLVPENQKSQVSEYDFRSDASKKKKKK
jgi:hypothetical protein